MLPEQPGRIDNAKLVEKLSEACDEVKGVEKKGVNQEQRYKYQRAADVAMAIRHELFSRGIVILQHEHTPEFHPFETKSGSKQLECRIGITYRIMGHGGLIEIDGYGVGRDSGDKAIWKAKTGAIKYFLRGLGLIPDEKEDPEYSEKPSAEEAGELSEPEQSKIRMGGIVESEKEHNGVYWYQIKTLTNEGETTVLVRSPKETDSGRLAEKIGWLVDIEVVPTESTRAGVFTLVRVLNVRKPLGEAQRLVEPTLPLDPEKPRETPSNAPQTPSGGKVITEPQRKRLYAMAKEVGMGDFELRELCGRHNVEHISTMTKTQYEAVCDELTNLKLGV